MRVLVTGSSGAIGSKIAANVSKHGTCVGVDLVPGKFTTQLASITDQGSINEIVSGVDAIIHTAAYHAPHIGMVSDDKFRDVNVHGTEVLLNMAIRHKLKRFVYTSTTSIYGCTTRPKVEAVWVTEDLAPNPEDIYDLTKLEAEERCQQASEAGLNTTILRMSRCFPEPDHLQVIYRLYRGVSGQDVAEAHWLAVSNTTPGTEIINISAESPFKPSDTRTLLSDPWQVIERIYPGTGKLFEQMNWEKLASIDRVYVIDKAKRVLNYQPRDNFWTYMQSKIR